MIVGNKCDDTRREVSSEEAQAFAESLPVPISYVETSAKMSINVERVFRTMALEIKTR